MKISKKNWVTTTFGEVAVQQKADIDRDSDAVDRYIAGEHMNSEDLHIRQWGVFNGQYLGPAFRRKFEKGDILYGSRRTYLKKVAVADFAGITANTTFVIKPNKARIDPGLLPFLMLSDSFTEHSIKHSKGSVNPYINWKDIAYYEFSLPPLLNDQKRIADLLWSIDRTIESYRSLLNSIDACKKSVLVEIGNKQESLREIGEVVDILDSQRKPLNSEQRASMKGDIPYYGANGIVDAVNDYIFDEDLVLVAEDGGNFHDYLTKTIAYMISGKSWVNNHAHVLKAKKSLRIKWLFYCLVHKDITKYIVGTTRVKLNQGALSKIRIYVPDIPEQDRLIVQIDSIFEAEKNVQNQISASEQIRKQIINQIFG